MNSTLGGEKTQELVETLRKCLPNAASVVKLEANEDLGYITFGWFGREFLVNKRKQVFELKGQKLYVTGSSMLMQAVLATDERTHRHVEQILHDLLDAEEFIGAKYRIETGLNRLEEIKQRLRVLVPNARRTPAVADVLRPQLAYA